MSNAKNIFAPKSNGLNPQPTPVQPVPNIDGGELTDGMVEPAPTNEEINAPAPVEEVKPITPKTQKDAIAKFSEKKKKARAGSKQHVAELEEQLQASHERIAELEKSLQSKEGISAAVGNQMLALNAQVQILQDTLMRLSSKK